MASKAFIGSQELEVLKKALETLPPLISGDETDDLEGYRRPLTDIVGNYTLKEFRKIPHWFEARPVLLGSLARGELCPKSDVDLLFLGENNAIQQVLNSIDGKGFRIGYRKPSNALNWMEGVEFKDCLSLLHARAETAQDKSKVEEQRQLIIKSKKISRELVKTVLTERKTRNHRYGGVLHFLEPNIKSSPGALRDIYQAEVVQMLGGECDAHGMRVLKYYKDFFLMVRIWLQVHGGGDILASALQPDCARGFGFNDFRDFMGQLQKGFGRSSFYSSLFIESAFKNKRTLPEIKSVPHALDIILKDHRIHTVGKVREFVVQNSSRWKLSDAPAGERRRICDQLFEVFWYKNDTPLQNLFRSRLIDYVFTDLKPLVGYVQHDQYHRFTADQHILQALRETIAVKKNPKTLGKLAKIAKEFRNDDWDILFGVALFHDMAKGRKEDHSVLGAQFVKKYLTDLALPSEVVTEVQWLVQNHLALSQAAFRENPLDPQTWHTLFEKGINPLRLKRLTIFTAIDIRATNPEAWTNWKEDLLHNLFSVLSEGPAESVRVLLESIKSKKNAAKFEGLIRNLDPFLVDAVGPKKLLSDLKKILKVKSEESVHVYRDRQGRQWIRFFYRTDKQGLFLSYVSRMYLYGLSIHHASVHTLDRGVYDWFCVGKRSPQQRLHLKQLQYSPSQIPSDLRVKFNEVELVQEFPEGALISFRGRDQKGALLSAGRGLLDEKFEILWARVHTWGREIDDQFFVRSRPDLHLALQDLRRKLLNHS